MDFGLDTWANDVIWPKDSWISICYVSYIYIGLEQK